MSNDESNKQTETVSARAHGEVDSCHNAESAESLHTRSLSSFRDGERESAAHGRAAHGRAGHLCVLVDITAEGLGSGIQPADALTFIAERLQASSESLVEAFNRSQGRIKDGLQLSVKVTRAVSGNNRTHAPLEFVSVDDCDDDDIETDPRADARPELTKAGYVAGVRASRLLGVRS